MFSKIILLSWLGRVGTVYWSILTNDETTSAAAVSQVPAGLERRSDFEQRSATRVAFAGGRRTASAGRMSGDVRRAYVIGLGANLGDRRATLGSAVRALVARATVLGVSDLYESRAVGPEQPDYLNAAVLLESSLTPRQLLGELLSIERGHGRERRERWGPRTLDLDLLHSPALVVSEPDLTLPHPELTARAFALAPLVDVAPEELDPRSGARYVDILRAIANPGVHRVETSATWWGPGSQAVAEHRPGRAE